MVMACSDVKTDYMVPFRSHTKDKCVGHPSALDLEYPVWFPSTTSALFKGFRKQKKKQKETKNAYYKAWLVHSAISSSITLPLALVIAVFL